MRIAAMAAGAVGGYFGGRLAAAGHDVSFIARGAQLEAIRKNGLKIESPLGNLHLDNVHATSDPKEVGPVDVALLPVGGWGPYLGEGHLDAGRAAEALARLAPRSAVPVHYGTYWPIGMDAVRPHEFHAPGDEFVRLAAERAPRVAVHRLGHGESVRLEVAR